MYIYGIVSWERLIKGQRLPLCRQTAVFAIPSDTPNSFIRRCLLIQNPSKRELTCSEAVVWACDWALSRAPVIPA